MHKKIIAENTETIFKQHGRQDVHPLTKGPLLNYVPLPGLGMISCRVVDRFLLILSDPFCVRANYAPALTAIERLAQSQNLHPIFLVASEEFATVCAGQDYICSSLGANARLPLLYYVLPKHRRNNARTARSCVTVQEELAIKNVYDLRFQRMEEITNSWLQIKPTKKILRFTVGVLEEIFAKEPRIFTARDKQTKQIVAFLVFYPYYENAKIAGYVLDMIRYAPEYKRAGMTEAMLQKALAQFKQEAVPELSLGWSAYYFRGPDKFQPRTIKASLLHKLARLIMRAVFHFGNSSYAYKNLARSKGMYHPAYTENYLIYKDISLKAVAEVMRLIGIGR